MIFNTFLASKCAFCVNIAHKNALLVLFRYKLRFESALRLVLFKVYVNFRSLSAVLARLAKRVKTLELGWRGRKPISFDYDV